MTRLSIDQESRDMKIYVPTPSEAGRVKVYDCQRMRSDDGWQAKKTLLPRYMDKDEGVWWFRDEAAARAASDVITRERIAGFKRSIALHKSFLKGGQK